MALVALQKKIPATGTKAYMPNNIYTKKNEEKRPGEAYTVPSRSRMAFTHTFPIGQWPRGHPVLRIPQRSKPCFLTVGSWLCTFVVLTYGLYSITAARPAPPFGACA